MNMQHKHVKEPANIIKTVQWNNHVQKNLCSTIYHSNTRKYGLQLLVLKPQIPDLILNSQQSFIPRKLINQKLIS
jgi:hypothetical protein